MNRIFSLVAPATILLAMACGKDDTQADPQTADEFITASIDGEPFEAAATGGLSSPLSLVEVLTVGGIVVTNPADTGGILLTLTFQTLAGNSLPAGDHSFVSDGTSGCNILQDEFCGSLAYGRNDGPSVMTYTSALATGRFDVRLEAIDFRIGGSAEGTFSGIVLDGQGHALPVTDGAFRVKIR